MVEPHGACHECDETTTMVSTAAVTTTAVAAEHRPVCAVGEARSASTRRVGAISRDLTRPQWRADVEAARAEHVERGVEVSEVQHYGWGDFVFVSDPDGNGWAIQQLPDRSSAPTTLESD